MEARERSHATLPQGCAPPRLRKRFGYRMPTDDVLVGAVGAVGAVGTGGPPISAALTKQMIDDEIRTALEDAVVTRKTKKATLVISRRRKPKPNIFLAAPTPLDPPAPWDLVAAAGAAVQPTETSITTTTTVVRRSHRTSSFAMSMARACGGTKITLVVLAMLAGIGVGLSVDHRARSNTLSTINAQAKVLEGHAATILTTFTF